MTTTRADVAELDSAAWAEQHPPESIRDAATWSTRGGDCPLTLAGAGAPLVSEFCIAEFAAAIGRSTDFGRIKMAVGLEFKYRLARHWDRVRSGTLEPWRACRVAAATLGLTKEAATYVDAQLASFAHKVGPAQLDRLVEQAIARFMPAQAAEDAEKAAEDRHVTFHHHQVSLNGTTWMQADLDLADALDLDAAISAGAEALRLAGSTESLDVRPRGGRWCSTCTSPRRRSPAGAAPWSWHRSTTNVAPCSPTRSVPGARTPTPPWS